MNDQLPKMNLGSTTEVYPYEQQLTSTQINVTLPSSLNLSASEAVIYPQYMYHVLSNVPLQSTLAEQATTRIIPQGDMETGESSGKKRKHKKLEHTQAKSKVKDGESERKGIDLQTKNSRNQMHIMSERRRRERIKEKMKALKEFIPNCNKTVNAEILDDAIAFIKATKRQIQMMSMGVLTHHMSPGINFQMQTYGMPLSPALQMIPPLSGSFHPPPSVAETWPPLYGPAVVPQPQEQIQFINPLQRMPAAILSTSIVQPTCSSTHRRQGESASPTTPRISTSLSL